MALQHRQSSFYRPLNVCRQWHRPIVFEFLSRSEEFLDTWSNAQKRWKIFRIVDYYRATFDREFEKWSYGSV